MYAPITNFAFFCILKVLRPFYMVLDTRHSIMANNCLIWPLHMRIVPSFGRRNTVKNFTNFPNLVQNCPFAPL